MALGRASTLAGALAVAIAGYLWAPPAWAINPAPPKAPVSPLLLLPPLPRAWIIVDDDTGNVIGSNNDHLLMAPASLTKLLTAVIAVEDLPPDADVPVSTVAASMPASSIGMKAGEVWTLNDSLHALLMTSANDAAVALAERTSGSREAFTLEMQRWAAILGLSDHPVLEDPAGLDAAGSFDSGNRLSARDLAIITRAALAVPEVRQIMSLQTYDFIGPDGLPHHLVNHNQLLWTYPGMIGGKTGFTDLAGITYVGVASRAGRTMTVVELGASEHWGWATAFLNQGFSTPQASETALDQLPPVITNPLPTPALSPPAAAPAASARGQARITSGVPGGPVPGLYWAAIPVVALSMGAALALGRIQARSRGGRRATKDGGPAGRPDWGEPDTADTPPPAGESLVGAAAARR